MTLNDFLNEQLQDPDFKREYDALEDWYQAELAKLSMRERMEDELDRQAYEEAMKEFRANPVTYTHAEVGKMLAISG